MRRRQPCVVVKAPPLCIGSAVVLSSDVYEGSRDAFVTADIAHATTTAYSTSIVLTRYDETARQLISLLYRVHGFYALNRTVC